MPEDKLILHIIAEHDRKNLDGISHAFDQGRIDADAAQYLQDIYSNGIDKFREVFYMLGGCFGAPKTAIFSYDSDTGIASENPVKIANVNPLSSYIVHHRLDEDPMRNQFFELDDTNVKLSASSIVSVIVGAEKSLERSLDKICGKYYGEYVAEISDAVTRVLGDAGRADATDSFVKKIRAEFATRYISNASEVVLGLIGGGHEDIAVQMVRHLDRIIPAHKRLNDVWRMKCLFDLIPQARTFIERVHMMFPDQVLMARDKFFDVKNPRNYRDAKIIMNIGEPGGAIIPLEIICQVRTFFEYDQKTHEAYKLQRRERNENTVDMERRQFAFMEDGIRKYNAMICRYTDDLIERMGWNILYSRGNDRRSLFSGFPRETHLYYPDEAVAGLLRKLDAAVRDGRFNIQDAPRELTPLEELEIFRFLARFILAAAMPYGAGDYEMPGDGVAQRLFNFVMREVSGFQASPLH
jgi:hypothetical protein